VAARFVGSGAALTFLAALGGDGRRGRPPVRRAADGGIWVLSTEPRAADREFAWALGGRLYEPKRAYLVSPARHRHSWDEFQSWPEVSLIELAAGVAPGSVTTEQQEVFVVTSGSLARWVVDRFQQSELDLRLAQARLEPVFSARSPEWSAVLIRVSGRGCAVPWSVSSALVGLPHTVVCRRAGPRLFIDQRLALPVSDEELSRQVPHDERWLLAGDLGVWRLAETSAEFAPPLRADAAIEPPPLPRAGRLPDLSVGVGLVADDEHHEVDAVLLRDEELLPLRRFLANYPAGDLASLVLGPGWHVLAEPGRDVSYIPFGVPLHRIGPGALYQELGFRLRPALPAPARARLFRLDETSLVVLRPGGSHRLSLDRIVPVWSLWLGPTTEADPAAEPLSAAALEILGQVDGADARVARPDLAADVPSTRHAGLHTEGFRLEQQGRLVEAAHKYWEAGEPELAGRLYELAAEAER